VQRDDRVPGFKGAKKGEHKPRDGTTKASRKKVCKGRATVRRSPVYTRKRLRVNARGKPYGSITTERGGGQKIKILKPSWIRSYEMG